MIGERLQEIRKDNGDTQADLARKMNVSKSTVQSWEQGKSSPAHEALIALCRLYDVSSDYLLGLSNVDRAIEKRRRSKLNRESLAALKSYEAYLLKKQAEEEA